MIDNEQDKLWQENFSTIATFPYSWLGKATELLEAANLVLVRENEEPLKGQYRNLSVYMMLTAFAFEDVIKGIILKRTPSIIDKDDQKNYLFSGHDLCRLAKQGKVGCSADETNLLRRLSKSNLGGRYPIPKDWITYKGGLDGSGSEPSGVFILPKDFNTIINFVHKLETELKSLGINCDLYDRSYTFTKDNKTIFVRRSITPHHGVQCLL